ncbi:thiamine pyrophosphate-binding protein [Synechococcus sp. W4D4]|uniref:thiamine pyrophosphate-binding protein n=1 Tax=Synechococcus sp. W4D4 TaxID=3392294 RepID=UPI0039ED5F90
MELRVSDFIAKRLAFLGCTDVYMVTGGASMHLNDSFLIEFPDTTHCLHHEQSCAMAAEAAARLQGRPSIVNVTAGPGSINAINGVFGAYVDSIPMFVVSGQSKRSTLVSSTDWPELRQLGDQEVDIVSMTAKVTKQSITLFEPLSVDSVLDELFLLSIQGRPGPVWLDVPIDVQSFPLPQSFHSKVFAPLLSSNHQSLPLISDDNLSLIAAKLLSAKRPLLYVGSGIRSSCAHSQFLELINSFNIPTVTSWNSHDLLWDDHPSTSGRPGTVGNRAGNFATQLSDVIIIIGSRLNIRQISYNWENFARQAWVAHVDYDEFELEKPTLNFDVSVHCDLPNFCQRLCIQLHQSQSSSQSFLRDRSHIWSSWLKNLSVEYDPVDEALPPQPDGVNPYRFIRALSLRIPERSTTVTSDGTACVVGFQASVIKEGQRLFHNSGCASMGYELPAAIGAFFATKSTIYCLAGDGSIMMNLQELAYISGMKLPIQIFLLNNSGYHSIRQTQAAYFNGRSIGCGAESGLPFPDFSSIAKGFDLAYSRLDDEKLLADFLDQALACRTPSLHEIRITLAQNFSPKVASRRLPDGSMVSSDISDMSPFLSKEVIDRISSQALLL